jgi:hypothetical protein
MPINVDTISVQHVAGEDKKKPRLTVAAVD